MKSGQNRMSAKYALCLYFCRFLNKIVTLSHVNLLRLQRVMWKHTCIVFVKEKVIIFVFILSQDAAFNSTRNARDKETKTPGSQ